QVVPRDPAPRQEAPAAGQRAVVDERRYPRVIDRREHRQLGQPFLGLTGFVEPQDDRALPAPGPQDPDRASVPEHALERVAGGQDEVAFADGHAGIQILDGRSRRGTIWTGTDPGPWCLAWAGTGVSGALRRGRALGRLGCC